MQAEHQGPGKASKRAGISTRPARSTTRTRCRKRLKGNLEDNDRMAAQNILAAGNRQAGRFAEAEALCRDLLATQCDQAHS